MPIFFQGVGDYALSLTVYAQVPFNLLFGADEWSIRFRSAVFSLIGVSAIYLILKHVVGSRFAWIAFLLCAISPVWIVHSRTGFEYITAGSLFLAAIYFYLRGLQKEDSLKPWSLSAICAALTFYSYTPARGWVPAMFAVFFFANPRIHLKKFRASLTALTIFGLLLVPYIYLHINYPEVVYKRLRAIGAGTVDNLFLNINLERLTGNWLHILNPKFWFFWTPEMESGSYSRHIIPGLTHLPIFILPLFLIGGAVLLYSWRKPFARTILLLVLFSPFPAALLEVNNARSFNVACLYLLITACGANAVLEFISGRISAAGWSSARSGEIVSNATVLLFGIYTAWLGSYLHYSAARKFADYGFYGIQYGAPQVYNWIAENADKYQEFKVSSHLFNAGSVFRYFYLSGKVQGKTEVVDFEALCETPRFERHAGLFLIARSSMEEVEEKGCPLKFKTVHTFYNPAGLPQIEAAYIEADSSFAEWVRSKDEARRKTYTSRSVLPSGSKITLSHPLFDMGEAASLFDGKIETIIRTKQVNPARFEIAPDEGSKLRALVVTISNTTFAEITASFTGPDGKTSPLERKLYSAMTKDRPDIRFDFGCGELGCEYASVLVEVHLTDQGDRGHVHVAEISIE